ncbi:MAG TPA: DNA-binding response regulator [Hydrogenophaga sp.]|uniref:LytR/AlgR family response regulator transcription factor n=1 Tax=Hydrogenophaga sp. TaxID=1904254 RepID=UPI0008D0D872|nr:LytTR family DNA-binding domain-containing protein [Hydrogenophaga sp.]OGA76132.1 MAG: DNA-binding response regulator [Burkholderiales bacterium GWE1_65_30]OGA91098.1 MAG: DNA-binding response regulator [Burkholderiales bacterium GWF1_66_17]PKO66550.1 MAG: DNA-binding response regulator [Betaproteobacteria bacterium HGW-Betaproteobacteria-16]HAX23337.1 DNA-binding response regulator [Hydrogenophaga sp.]HBU19177.1 DNA-binding response regulator [Hydrogenophaga sp.]
MTLATLPTAVIAEDEPVLARTLTRLLEQVWPELRIVGVADDGLRATELALALVPDVVFLDIKMPGRTGIEVAEVVADDWPDDRAEPLFVFITAYDNFAVPAFERAAVDYLLKPATADRLQQSVARLKARLAGRAASPDAGNMAALMQRMQSLTAPDIAETDSRERLKVIRAGVGNTVRMIPVADVVCFEATEKYVNVVTPTGEALVRMSLRELMARIDSTDFIQVHRSVMVNSNAIMSATRDENGHYSLSVRGLQRPLKVSRAFGHLFRPM